MSVYINDEIIERIKDRADIVEVISQYVDLRKSGNSYMGLCPFHSEKTPSFSVNESKEFYKCFGCGKGGDVINFVMEKENLDFIGAIKFLAERYNIQLENRKVDKKKEKKKKDFYDMNRDAARYFYSNLTKNKQVVKYLHNRNIANNIINRFGLGYSLDGWENLYKYLKEKGYKEEEIEKNGLIVKRDSKDGYYDRFRNRLMFPIIDERNRVIGFGGRVMDDTMPKYLNSRDSLVFNKSNNLYGINLVRKHSNREKVILVEGYMDVISLSANGINYSLASLGTSLTQNQARILKRYGRTIYICYDSDQAGINATIRAIDILTEEGIKPRIIQLPPGYDPDDFINEKGKLEFEKLVNNSINFVDYQIKNIEKGYNLNEVEDKIDFTRQVADLIGGLTSPVEQDAYIKQIAERTGISYEAIMEEVRQRFKRDKSTSNPRKVYKKQVETRGQEEVNIKNTGAIKAEQILISILLKEPSYLEYIQEDLSEDYLSSDFKQVYKEIKSVYFNNSGIDSKGLISKLNLDDNMDNIIKSLISLEIDYDYTVLESIITDLIKKLEVNYLEEERNNILKNINKLESDYEEDREEDIINLFEKLTILNDKIKLIKDK